MIVTVFGGTGFVGRYVVAQLAQDGATIRVATRHPASAYFLRCLGRPGQIVPVNCDVFDDASVFNALDGATHAVNLIGILTQSGKNNFENIHHLVARRIAENAAKARLQKLVHVSAIGADIKGGSAYARSKGFGEQAVHLAFPDATILRPSIIFGPEDNFFNRFARMARFTPFLPLIGGGKTRFQPVYVGDVASAVATALGRKDTNGKVYELGGPDILSFRALLEKMMRHTGQNRRLAWLPWPIALMKGAVLGRLPGRLLTADQVRSLKTDNVVGEKAMGFKALGIAPKSLDLILPTYLNRYGGSAKKRRAT